MVRCLTSVIPTGSWRCAIDWNLIFPPGCVLSLQTFDISFQFVNNQQSTMGRNYLCEYCDKRFKDDPNIRKKHFDGLQHQRAKKEHYANFKGWFAISCSSPQELSHISLIFRRCQNNSRWRIPKSSVFVVSDRKLSVWSILPAESLHSHPDDGNSADGRANRLQCMVEDPAEAVQSTDDRQFPRTKVSEEDCGGARRGQKTVEASRKFDGERGWCPAIVRTNRSGINPRRARRVGMNLSKNSLAFVINRIYCLIKIVSASKFCSFSKINNKNEKFKENKWILKNKLGANANSTIKRQHTKFTDMIEEVTSG